jgi:hypothetical protein
MILNIFVNNNKQTFNITAGNNELTQWYSTFPAVINLPSDIQSSRESNELTQWHPDIPPTVINWPNDIQSYHRE